MPNWEQLSEIALKLTILGNVGIARINHPPNHHEWDVQTIQNGWFIIAIPTLQPHQHI